MKTRGFEKEFTFKTSKSSGPGGQNVNKVETKVELRFDWENSNILTQDEKIIIMDKNISSIIIIVSQEERSQLKNKNKTIEKFYKLLEKLLFVNIERKESKVSKEYIENRIKNKKIHSKNKLLRNKIFL